MVRSSRAFTLVVACAVLLSPGVPSLAAVSLEPAAEQTVRQFLEAYVEDDRATLQQLTPRKLKNRFGPCELLRTPYLINPRVKLPKGWIDFSGPTKDPHLPSYGTLQLKNVSVGSRREWRVTHLFWHERSASASPMIQESPTEADRNEEQRVEAVARAYFEAWIKSDFEKMNKLSLDWIHRPRAQRNPLRLIDLRLRSVGAGEEGIKVNFEGKLVLFHLLPRPVSGLVYVLKEGGKWKVRGTSLRIDVE